jgi:hypothetical protein
MSTPREPLDRDEAELARLLRSLPSAEPGAEIDARILAAARAAPARRSPVRRPWIWSLGTAAAAVLAFGTLLRMQQTGIEPLPEPAAMRMQESAPTPGAEPGRSTDSFEAPAERAPVAASEGEGEATAPASPPAERAGRARAEAKGETTESGRPAATPEPAAMAVPAPPPAPPAPPPAPAAPPAVLRDAPAASTESAVQRLQAPRLAAPPASAPVDPESRQREQQARSRARESDKSTAAQAFPAQEEAEADPLREPDEALFERVRLLLAQGNAAEARRLLREWRAAHPDAELPADLEPLLE